MPQKKADSPKNTDPVRVTSISPSPIHPGLKSVGESSMPEGARASHQRLFGKGTKVSAPDPADPAAFRWGSPDEAAFDFRPRAEKSGDIHLPNIKKKSAAKPASPKKR